MFFFSFLLSTFLFFNISLLSVSFSILLALFLVYFHLIKPMSPSFLPLLPECFSSPPLYYFLNPFTSSILSCNNLFSFLLFTFFFLLSPSFLQVYSSFFLFSLAYFVSSSLLSLCPPMSSSPLLQPHLSMVTCCSADGFLHSPCYHWLAPAVKIPTHPVRQVHCLVGGAMKQPIAWSIKTADCDLMIVDRGEHSIVGQTASSE